MRTRMLKFMRGGAGIALAASGLGLVGGLGVGLATSGVASAASHTVSGTFHCATPIGPKHVAFSIVDSNTMPTTLHKGTTFTSAWKLTFAVTKSLIRSAHAATAGLTSLPIHKAQLDVTKVGFSGPAFMTATNLPVTIPITGPGAGSTLTTGYTAVFDYAAAFHVTTTTGTISLTPGNATLTVVVPFSCYSPGHTVTQTPTTATIVTVTGSNTNGPVDTATALPALELTLSPTTGTMLIPPAQATVPYSYTGISSAGGLGTDTFSLATNPGWLSLTQTGTHTAKIHGTPATATATLTLTIKVSVHDVTGTTVTNTYTLHITAKPGTPTILQPFKLTVTGGSLTMTCTGPTPVETQATAHTCTLITLGTVKLNATNQLVVHNTRTLYISTARGGATDAWTLNAIMVPTTATKQAKDGVTVATLNPTCATVQGFCNLTTTTQTRIATHLINTSILPNYLYLHGYTCKPQQTPLSPYFNTNPTPATTAGRTITTVHHYGLSTVMTLCTAAVGHSGGEFIVKTGTYSLIVPPNVYAGTYYGTVQFTLIGST